MQQCLFLSLEWCAGANAHAAGLDRTRNRHFSRAETFCACSSACPMNDLFLVLCLQCMSNEWCRRITMCALLARGEGIKGHMRQIYSAEVHASLCYKKHTEQCLFLLLEWCAGTNAHAAGLDGTRNQNNSIRNIAHSAVVQV